MSWLGGRLSDHGFPTSRAIAALRVRVPFDRRTGNATKGTSMWQDPDVELRGLAFSGQRSDHYFNPYIGVDFSRWLVSDSRVKALYKSSMYRAMFPRVVSRVRY